MPSKHTLREFTPNYAFHIYNRGVEKRKVFLDKQDYKIFLYYLRVYLIDPEKIKQESPNTSPFLLNNNLSDELEILTYSLMPNHFHLQLLPSTSGAVPQLMRQLSNAYTRYFNDKYDRVGSLFQGRYKAARINTDEANIHVHRYVHLNPVVAGIVRRLEEYPWSSFGEYQNEDENNLCKTNEFLSHFKSFVEYRRFLLDEIDEEDLVIDNVRID